MACNKRTLRRVPTYDVGQDGNHHMHRRFLMPHLNLTREAFRQTFVAYSNTSHCTTATLEMHIERHTVALPGEFALLGQ